MILPKSMLENVIYYEYYPVEDGAKWVSVFRLHFKQWWKPMKKIKIPWTQIVDHPLQTKTKTYWEESDESAELRNQLHELIKVRNE